MGNLLQELKRRKVFRVAAVYAVVAWLLIEVTSTILPTFDAPAWVNQTVTLLLLLGFPVALILSWAYEVTPEGIKADAGTQSATAPAQSTDRNLIYLILALVVMVAGFQIADRFLANQASSSLAGNQASNSSDSSTQVVRSILPLGDLGILPFGLRSFPSFSADGSRFIYTVSSGPYNGYSHQIYIRDLDQLEPRSLGPPNNGFGALSPDGEWVFFTNDNSMWRRSVNGGPAQLVAERMGRGGGFGFGPDDTVYFRSTDNTLHQVSASGGESQSLGIPFIADMNQQLLPQSLPGGKALLFTRYNLPGGADETGRIEWFDLETKDTRILIETAYSGRYSPTGHITFMRGSSLWAVPFDLESLALSGPEVLLIEGIESNPNIAFASYSMSDSGNLIYIPDLQLEARSIGQQSILVEAESIGQQSVLAWVDRTGTETVLNMIPQLYSWPALSPDGNRVALTIQLDQFTVNSDLWAYDLERGTLSRITFSGLVSSSLWSTDGDRLIYGSLQGIRSINSNGLGRVEELTNLSTLVNSPLPTTLSPDGQQLLFAFFSGPEELYNIHLLNMTPEHQSVLLINSEFSEHGPVISPNSRWLAYTSNETGRDEVYVRPYPEIEAGKWQISTGGGAYPQWAPSGEELFYRNRAEGTEGTQTLVVTIETEPEFRAGTPQSLFTTDHLFGQGAYTVSADGQRFLMLKPVARESRDLVTIPTNAVLVENFDEELKKLVPADPQ